MLIPHKHFLSNRQINLIALLLCMMFVFTSALSAQGIERKEIEIDAKMQLEIIDSVSSGLNNYYVFPDVAKKMEAKLREQYKSNAYKEIKTLQAFTDRLSSDMIDVSHDKHLGVRGFQDEILAQICDTMPDETEQQRRTKDSQLDNYGFKKVEQLNGNIGYIKLNGFHDTEDAAPTAIAAMNFLAYSDAIIFDLRDNGGGSPSMIQLLMSYFFEEPVHLNSFYVRETDSIEQFWTQQYVSGPKMTDALVYILTSNYTFSAAEEFSYNFKNLKRGIIVGETTGGGAHPVMQICYDNLNVVVRVSYGRAINPISGTNWEGVGVKPDIDVPRDDALDAAYKDALSKLIKKTEDEGRKFSLNWIVEGIEAKMNPVTLDETTMKKFTGSYNERTIIFEDGKLYYQREGRPKFELLPLKENLFYIKGLDYFRLEVELDKNDNPIALVGHYDNGTTDRSEKSK